MSFGDAATKAGGGGAQQGDGGLGPLSERLSLGVAARLSRYLQVLTQARKIGHADALKQFVDEEDSVAGVLAVPPAAAQGLAALLVDAGVKIIFNYSEALLQVPPEVTVHTSSPAVDLLYALYFYLT